MSRSYCLDPDCIRPVFRDELCEGHFKRRQRGATVSGALTPPFETAWERMISAFWGYIDADGMDAAAFERAKDRLRKAIKAWKTGQRSHRRNERENGRRT